VSEIVGPCGLAVDGPIGLPAKISTGQNGTGRAFLSAGCNDLGPDGGSSALKTGVAHADNLKVIVGSAEERG
jgi:hypothetical protein